MIIWLVGFLISVLIAVFFLGGGASKTALKLVASRAKLLKNKKEVVVKQLRRDLAQLLEQGQVQTARIRVS